MIVVLFSRYHPAFHESETQRGDCFFSGKYQKNHIKKIKFELFHQGNEDNPTLPCKILTEGAQRMDDFLSEFQVKPSMPHAWLKAEAQPSCQSSAEPWGLFNACLVHKAVLI